MSDSATLIIHTDGAARGNPGPAAYAYTIAAPGMVTIEEAGCLGNTTCNQAEYTALVKALEHAARLGTHHRLRVRSDSELMVKQMNGEYRVKDSALRSHFEKASALVALFPEVKIKHVRRAENSDADRLCNEALDGLRRPSLQQHHEPVTTLKETQPRPTLRPVREAKDPMSDGRNREVREEVLGCLSHAAATWAKGDSTNPAPEEVLDEIWNILAAAGVLTGAPACAR